MQALLFFLGFLLIYDGGRELSWSEEFNYAGLPDSTIWTYDRGDGCPNICGWGNREIQHYTVRQAANARVEGGLLIIEAHKGDDGQWTSARLKSQGLKTFGYGHLKVRARLPGGAGTWPAIWMLGANFPEVNWPACGEIDIMEHVGKAPTTVHGSLHSPSTYGATQNTGFLRLDDAEAGFHDYEVIRTPEKITFLVDGREYYSYQPATRDGANWPFDGDFFLILNIAIGGNWGSDARYETGGLKNGVDPSLSSARMEVDYIRFYE